MTREGTALVTGASSGIGREIAVLLAKTGFTVFGTSRTPSSDQGERGFQMLPLDVRSDESVNACVKAILTQTGRLDVLINNAGYALVGASEETSLAEARAQLETNFFGVVRMVNAVLPAMRAQRAGRIINVSSLAGLVAIPFSAFYCASKFALEAYSEALRHELKPFGIFVSLLEPGFVSTGLARSVHVAAEPISDYDQVRTRAIASIASGVESGIAPARVAETALRVVRSGSPRLRYRVGRDAKWIPRIKGIVPEAVFESTTRKMFELTR